MNRKKLLIRLSIVIISIVAISFLIHKNKLENQEASIKWMISTTGFYPPKGAEFIDYFPSNLFGEILKYKLEPNTIDSVIAENQLKLLGSRHGVLMIQLEDIENGKKTYKIFAKNDCYFKRDTIGDRYFWNLLIKKSTGELWTEVLYRD